MNSLHHFSKSCNRIIPILVLILVFTSGFTAQGWSDQEISRNTIPTGTALQFSSNGNIVRFGPNGTYLTTGRQLLHETFVGINSTTPQSDIGDDGQIHPLGEVTYNNLWDGINLSYDTPPSGILRSTYYLAPGADPAQIRFNYNLPVSLDPNGALVFTTGLGVLSASAPVAWQEIGDQRIPVEVEFKLSSQNGGQQVSFEVGEFDPEYGLTIDPTFTWNTFMGGTGSDAAYAIAVDSAGNIYVTGNSDRSWGSPLRAYAGGIDAFVAMFNSNGVLQWNTFLGGTGNDYGYGITVDNSGNIYIAGYSERTWGSPVVGYSGNADAFAARLNNSGSRQWHTFMGSLYNDYAYSITADGSGNVYLTGNSGYTWGSPVAPFSGGNTDAIIVKLNGATGVRIWHTFLGGLRNDFGRAITLDASGSIYITGQSDGTWGSPVTPISGTGNEGFAAKVDGLTGTRIWNTFIGGIASSDVGQALALDQTGNIYITGSSTTNWGSPIVPFTRTQDAFAIKLNNNGTVQWLTFIGGTGTDIGRGIGIDTTGYIYITGNSNATWGSPANPYAGSNDAFLTRLNADGARQWNSFMGGSGSDVAYGISISPTGRAYNTGVSPSSWGSPIGAFSGGNGGFIGAVDLSGMVIQGAGISIVSGDSSPNGSDDTDFGSINIGTGDSHTFTIQNTDISNSLTLNGSPVVSISGANSSDFSVTTPPDSPISIGNSTTFTIQFSPSTPGIRTAVLSIANSDILDPYTFSVQGTGVAVPEIEVLSNSTLIANNDATPSTVDNTDFDRVITGTTHAHIFTIQNEGTIDLDLSGTPLVTISGVNAADFTVTVQPASPISAGASTSFTVEFTPGADGLRTATLSIANSDVDESPYTFDLQGTGITAPVVVFGPNTSPSQNTVLTTGIFTLTIEFNMALKSDMGAQAGNSPANYLLFSDGGNGFQTVDCTGGIAAGDTPFQVNGAIYSDSSGIGPYVVTLNVNNGQPLPPGTYRLLICGTTSIENLAGVELNYGADSALNFTINTNTSMLPATGFAPGSVHTLPIQPVESAYSGTGMFLEIPSLHQEMSIVGVPQTQDGWDITWLGSNAGWLQGSAFPTWDGNTVLTGHVWDAFNNPGPFVNLRNLRYGDTIYIHAWGMTYVYQVRENLSLTAFDVDTVFLHEEQDWITLVTCESYDAESGSYLSRRLVRAVLVGITPGMN